MAVTATDLTGLEITNIIKRLTDSRLKIPKAENGDADAASALNLHQQAN